MKMMKMQSLLKMTLMMMSENKVVVTLKILGCCTWIPH